MDDIFQFQSELLYIWNITESFDSFVWSKKKKGKEKKEKSIIFSLRPNWEPREVSFFPVRWKWYLRFLFPFCLIFHYYKVSEKQMFVRNKITPTNIQYTPRVITQDVRHISVLFPWRTADQIVIDICETFYESFHVKNQNKVSERNKIKIHTVNKKITLH